ncbi:hypothetical protein D9757_002540 [Collybiopsis confluens]|uniref:COQ9 C-terminal domain-containing protein n=1 Tax=Collybiopsis confluens TaxID=2823264 RepID=A0A8H5HXV1_9AGAR|nr:hypothetical protein D9757_002540 [Collybiopsis confluens]
MSRSQLLSKASLLIKTHGFTREALARSVLGFEGHTEPLSDTAVSSLFGRGDEARKTLIQAWLDEGRLEMRSGKTSGLKGILQTRLEYNKPAFALLASTERGFPPLDPRPALRHAATVADEALYISGDTSLQLEWYTQRASIAAVYSAAELHQLTSPETAPAFLDSLLDGSFALKNTLGEVQLFSGHIFKSWQGILKSKGIL